MSSQPRFSALLSSGYGDGEILGSLLSLSWFQVLPPHPHPTLCFGFSPLPWAAKGVRGNTLRPPFWLFLENSHRLKIFLPKKLLECLPRCPLLPPERLRWNTNEVFQGALGRRAWQHGLEEDEWGSS